ncbi:hypothetical protein GQX73_g2254 [Xylaria multiplex]|uniref:Uncharacterized protein n=1 Tax=Xylaria multiplex TaxID=323545 RepID=A0A7C8IST4_9PEZI|nr:hypothetical protein GQX73_g2254 [Xylaria multiplex]
MDEDAANKQFLQRELNQDEVDAEARSGNDNALYIAIYNSTHTINRVFTGTNTPIEYFEDQIHKIWYTFIASAQNINAHHPAQDRLLRMITSAQKHGILCKVKNPKRSIIPEEPGTGGPSTRQLREIEGLDVAETSQGRIWVDLPFLVPDVRDAWKQLMKQLMQPSAPVACLCNYTSAVARLAESSVCDDAFSQCGLEIMKLALETPSSTLGDYVPLLVLVHIWLRYAGDVLLRLCLDASPRLDSSWALDEQQLVGPLAQQANIGLAAAWSQERFSFWKDRLVAMAAEAKDKKSKDKKSIEALCATSITYIWETRLGVITSRED